MKFTDNQKFYLKNFLTVLAVYGFFVLLFGFMNCFDMPVCKLDINKGFWGVGIFSPLIVAHLIATLYEKQGKNN